GSPYAERAYSVIQVTDGSFLMAGSTDYFGPPRQKGYLVNIAGPVLYGSVAGYVSDDVERAPIESVYVSSGQAEAWTDVDGYYSLRDVLIGNRDVSFSHPDYRDTTVTGVGVTLGNTTILDVQMSLFSGCDYAIGDVNGSGNYNGLDITYGVSYFKGGSEPMCPYGSCPIAPCDAFFYCGDVNGSCNYNGLDITYGVAYFKGGPSPIPCGDCPPLGAIAESEPISRMR
ncbi:MAG: carboxypeptidase regulatory-like domain-containing protein, partial [Candidatus Zixiibacteriota bacterium]